MPKFFPGVFFAALAAVPGFIIGSAFAARRMWELPVPELLAALSRGSLHFTLLYGLVALVYGGIVWFCLRLVGLLNLGSLLIAGLIPVVLYIVWSLVSRGFDAGWGGVAVAFGVPAVFVSVALWWFTVAMPARG